MIACLINGKPSAQISILDRAVNYGDGVFETILVSDNKIHFWQEHYQRLTSACDKLNINCPTPDQLISDIGQIIKDDDRYVVKIIITRGEGGRGYLAEESITCNRLVTLNAYPGHIADYANTGVSARLCQHRLYINPALAGIKHLNRLDQVIARNEWHNNDYQEGIMLNQADHLVEGTATNLFMQINDEWITAAAKNCAVDGIVRQAVINSMQHNNIKLAEKTISTQDIDTVKAAFLTNSIWGIVPLRNIGQHQLSNPETIQTLQSEFKALSQQSVYEL